jgi:two-component system response regulator FixJ
LPVILITGFGDIPTAVRAMRAGAFTFLEKPCREHELSSSIERALARSSERDANQAQREEIRSRLATLTPEEHSVMEAVTAGKANKVIASELDIGLRTVELRRASVLKKLHADSLAELVRMTILCEGS